MIEDPVVVGGVLTATATAVAAAVRHYRKGGTVEADVDGDGEPEITFESNNEPLGDCNDPTEDPAYSDAHPEEWGSNTTTEVYEGSTDAFQSTQPTNPTPERVTEIGEDLAQITGIGPARAEDLRAEGFESAADLYYATDENVTDVSGIGSHALDQIRGDVGGIDYEGNGSSSDSTDDDSTSEAEADSGVSPDGTDGDGSSTDEAAA